MVTKRTTLAAGNRHREREALRSREQSRSVRDIAPLPPIVNPKRRALSHRSLRLFCETYFKAKFPLAWATYHLKIINRLEKIVTSGGLAAIAAPRGSGKSTLTLVAAVWALVYGYRRYVVLVGANKTEAQKLLDAIKSALQNNKLLFEDFPEITYPIFRLNGSALLARGQLYIGNLTNMSWGSMLLTLPTITGSKASGSRVMSSGIFGAIRGKNSETTEGETIRPDLILIDDPQTDQMAKSPTQIAKAEDVINRTIFGLAGPGVSIAIAMTVTVIQQGDLSDRYLNVKIYPQWNGLRYKMLEQFPDDMKLWEEYAEFRRAGKNSDAAEFYRNNREAMRKGAVVSWEANFTENEIDALQYAMNLYIDDPLSFSSERQNEPIELQSQDAAVPAKTVRSRLNGYKHRVVPMDTYKVTGFIDIHDNLLYYCVTAWTDEFTGRIIDYGTFPEQHRKTFSLHDSGLNTMKLEFGGKKERYVAMGIEALVTDLLSQNYEMDGDADGVEPVKIDLLLIDSGYMPDVIRMTLQKIGQSNIVRPSYGRGVGAKIPPMNEWKSKPKEQLHLGHHWVENRSENWKYRCIKIDTNYWKSHVHNAFDLAVTEEGSLSLWGRNAEQHRMFSEHITAEKVQLVEVGSRKVHEWQPKPNQDNHWFDTLVGCAVGASVCGIKLESEKQNQQKRRTKNWS
ncbi:MAG: phage terminase large subunit family protein [Planctomycetaceae bacterium]|jgi:hypothetical protein|nr:phage terminase large subunit family protein [Planctomycetaceae bacterium]